MNIPREEALTNEIFEVVQGWQTSTIGWQSSSDALVSEANYKKAREDHNNECKRRIAKVLQSRLAEPDAGANVEFPTPAYLRVSDDPVDISITDYYTEPQLRSYADARVAASRLAEAEQEHVPVFTTGHCKEKAQKGGCQLHNLQCSYPACDRKLTAQQVAPK